MCLNLSRQVSHYGDVGCQLTQIQEVNYPFGFGGSWEMFTYN
jgi:hypothetical protein